MATPIFPVGPGSPGWGWSGILWNVEKTPMFNTKVQQAASGRTSRVALYTAPLWSFTLQWEFLRDQKATVANQIPASPRDEYRQILGFFLARKGRFDPFFFLDPTDSQVTNQQIAIGDGTTRSFQCVRSFATFFVEPVGGLNIGLTNTFTGGAGGVTLNSPQDGWITFGTAPTIGTPVIWTAGNYFFKVCFKRDESTFRNFVSDYWDNRRVDFESVRP
jgi:hypothetical protein